MQIRTLTAVALALTLAACSVADTVDSTTSTSAPTTSTSTEPTTTTTEMLETSLINGLPVEDPTLMERRVLGVKIDNHPLATPQSGIEDADMVIEVLVEGITRFMTIWHESDSEYLGPMRSGRPTDPTILAGFNHPTFARSGAQDWVQGFIAARDIPQIGEIGNPATFRIPERKAPHNLYVDTNELRLAADKRDFPDDPPEGPIWEFGPMPATAERVESVTMDFAGNIVSWGWDPLQKLWLRTAYRVESNYLDEDGEEQRIAVPVIVALYVEQYTVSPPAGTTGKALPSSKTTGTGTAFVFADGKVVQGTWEREEETDWFTLSDEDGETILVPPGKVWVALVPDDDGLVYE